MCVEHLMCVEHFMCVENFMAATKNPRAYTTFLANFVSIACYAHPYLSNVNVQCIFTEHTCIGLTRIISAVYI